MKYIMLYALLLGILFDSMAQSIERNVFASAGKSSPSGNTIWNFTIGEPLTKYFNTPGTKVTQGFQQGLMQSLNNELVIDPQSPTGGHHQCSNLFQPEPPVVLSSCGAYDMSYDVTSIEGTACNGSTTITWEIFDECGNTAFWVQTYTYADTEAPQPSNPIPAVENFSCNTPFENVTVTFNDNCAMGAIEVVPTYEYVEDECGIHEYKTWTVTDLCGNAAFYENERHFIDTEAPYVESSSNPIQYLDCNEPLPAMPVFVDDCAEYNLNIDVEEINSGQWSTTRNYTVTDPCGNVFNYSEIFYFSCCNPPTFTLEQAIIEGECGFPITPEAPVFDDANDDDLQIEYFVNAQPSNCGYIETHNWTATNDCGESVTAHITVNYLDTQTPFVYPDEPVEILESCDDSTPTPPNFQDNCDTDLEISITQEIVFQGILQRTWTAYDDCGFGATFTQHIQSDCCPTPIVVTMPDDLHIECGQSYIAPAPTFQDPNGDQLTIEVTVEHVIMPCGAEEVYTFTATNTCGQSVSDLVSVFITDLQAPHAIDGQQSEFIVECGGSMPSAPQFEDYCDLDLDVAIDSETNTNNTITRVWKATDDCGFTANFTQTINVSCCTAPVVEFLPESIQAECGDDVDIQEPTFSNIPDESLNISYNVTTENSTCGYTETHTWTATNSCGLSVTATVDVFYTDTQEPFAIGGQDSEFLVECGGTMPAAPAFEDACDSSLDIVIDSETNTNNTITRVWKATDDCGFTATFTQTISVSCCETPIVVDQPADLMVECGDDFTVIAPAFEDPNGGNLEISSSISTSPIDCGVLETHTYTATNNCGLSASADVLVYITDTQEPYALEGQAEEFFITCTDDLPTAPQFGDVCDQDLTIVLENDLSTNNTIVRDWSATDDCGNSTTFTQVIHVSCCTAPEVVSIPATQYIECGTSFVLPEPTFLNTSDDELTIDHTSTIAIQDCGYIETHTWTATNACGLSASASFDVVVEDNTTPFIDQQLINIEISCGDVIPAPIVVTASDNCDNNVVVTSEIETIYEDECGNITWQVNYEAIDDCGNTTYTSYLIIMEDNEEPVLSSCPDNITLDCGETLPPAPIITAMDGCAGELEVLYEEFELGAQLDENVESQCGLLTPVRPANNPCGYPVNWALALFGLPKAHRYYYLSEGTFTEMNDGTILVEATIHNAYTPSNGWNISFRFNNGMTWEEWSAQQTPHSFKADCGSIGANHADWMYYLMMNMPGAEMVGIGGYAGSTLSTLHAPSNGYFGFQLGDGANNYNAVNNGFGGWFRYSGTLNVNGVPYGSNNGYISGAGDLALELNCCEGSTYIRQWTASDCSGNTATCVQEITIGNEAIGVNSQNMPDPNAVLETEMAVKVMKAEIDPNPASGMTMLKFNTIENANTQVRIYSATGEMVATLMDTESEEDIDFVIDFDTSALPNGVYFCKITNGTETHTDRLIVTH